MVSVCMATYNGQKYIKEQVDSILMQLETQDELVVSDDGSSDSTIEILRQYNDPRIKIFNNNGRKGVIGNFQNALSKSIGDFIFLADQDDVWIEGKVEVCIEALKNADLVMHDACVVDQALNIVHPSFFVLHKSHKGFLPNLIRNSYIGCCIGFRRSLLNFALPLPRKIKSHDMWFGLAAELIGTTVFIDKPYHLYRRHGANASTASEKSDYSIIGKLRYRWGIIRPLIGRRIKQKLGL